MNDDLISRQAALDDAHSQLWYRMNQQGMKDRIDEWLKNLPSAEPEQKTGRWQEVSLHRDNEGDLIRDYECSNCLGGIISVPDGEKDLPRYCPDCGAEMR